MVDNLAFYKSSSPSTKELKGQTIYRQLIQIESQRFNSLVEIFDILGNLFVVGQKMFIENFAAKTLSQIISGLEEEALLFIEIYFQNINSSPKASGTGLGKISVIRLDHF